MLKLVSQTSSGVEIGSLPMPDAGVREEQVDLTERVLCLADQLDVAVLGPDVGADPDGGAGSHGDQLRCSVGCTGRVEVGCDDVRACGVEPLRESSTDASRCAGDHDMPSREIHCRDGRRLGSRDHARSERSQAISRDQPVISR